MAPLPESSTERYKYTYVNAVNEHSLILRVVSGTPVADVDTIMQDILTNVGIGCMASQITSLEMAPLGSNIFNPVSGSVLVGDSFGSGPGNAFNDATAISFTGRGSDGRRSRIFLFGWVTNDPNFRITPAENPNIGTLVTALNDPDVPLLTIGGTAPIFHAYANVKANDHWVKRARS